MNFLRTTLVIVIIAVVLPLFAGNSHLRLATTTSTENSGLLDYLLPVFQQDTGIQVDIIAVGTGKAIKLGENGDVDVILVHARSAEDKFVTEGYGINRRDVMHNDFIIMGPSTDPAGIRNCKTVTETLRKIYTTKSLFISRGDNSGTQKKEKAIWKQAELQPDGNWYKEIGQGMGAVLVMTNELKGYTLTDRGTYLSMRDKLNLDILFAGDPVLFNPYGIIAVNPEKHPEVNHKDASSFINWITSEKAQRMIGSFQVGDELLFYPDAIK